MNLYDKKFEAMKDLQSQLTEKDKQIAELKQGYIHLVQDNDVGEVYEIKVVR